MYKIFKTLKDAKKAYDYFYSIYANSYEIVEWFKATFTDKHEIKDFNGSLNILISEKIQIHVTLDNELFVVKIFVESKEIDNEFKMIAEVEKAYFEAISEASICGFVKDENTNMQ